MPRDDFYTRDEDQAGAWEMDHTWPADVPDARELAEADRG
jgi:hypothetical protein